VGATKIMSKKPKVMMWVDPNFKKVIKSESAMNNKSILDYTKELSWKVNNEKQKNDKKIVDWSLF